MHKGALFPLEAAGGRVKPRKLRGFPVTSYVPSRRPQKVPSNWAFADSTFFAMPLEAAPADARLSGSVRACGVWRRFRQGAEEGFICLLLPDRGLGPTSLSVAGRGPNGLKSRADWPPPVRLSGSKIDHTARTGLRD